MRSNKYHLTQSLLQTWQRVYSAEDGYEELVSALKREAKPPTEAMLDGIEFENCVNNVLNGAYLPEDHKWYQGIIKTAERLVGSQQQVNLKKDIIVNGVCFELNGVLDFLRAGVIYDTKFSKHYYLGKYRDSPQCPMYFYLVPEAREFQYLSCDGQFVYKETYRPEDTEPIEYKIKQFMAFLDSAKLADLYTKNWNLTTYYKKKKGSKT